MLNDLINDIHCHVKCYLSNHDIKTMRCVNQAIYMVYSAFISDMNIKIADLTSVVSKLAYFPKLKTITIQVDTDMLNEYLCDAISTVAKRVPETFIELDHDVCFDDILSSDIGYILKLGYRGDSTFTYSFFTNLMNSDRIRQLHLYENMGWYMDKDIVALLKRYVSNHKNIRVYIHDFSDPVMYMCVHSIFLSDNTSITVVIKDDTSALCGLLAIKHFNKDHPNMLVFEYKDGYTIPQFIKTKETSLDIITALPEHIQQRWYWIFMP